MVSWIDEFTYLVAAFFFARATKEAKSGLLWSDCRSSSFSIAIAIFAIKPWSRASLSRLLKNEPIQA
jgi:hypothetical protein